MIGWYGSETLGDRGIFLGIIELLYRKYGHCEFTISSFNTFFTKRCIEEDLVFIKKIDSNFSYNIIDNRRTKETKASIKKSDVVVIGGGPLMSIGSMYALDYYVAYAANNRIPVLNMGTGIGDLKGHYQKLAMNIVKNCSISVFRDKHSIEYTEEKLGKNDLRTFSFDPAILPCRLFQESHILTSKRKKDSTCSVNFRNFPSATYTTSTSNNIDAFMKNFLSILSENFDVVELIPQHNFFYGHDDRLILSELRQSLELPNVKVLHYPQSLYDLYESYFEATCVVGMRYHAVVFQTLLNGNNIIVDYTPRERGKISGFMSTVAQYSTEFNSERYFNLFDPECDLSIISEKYFSVDNAIEVNNAVYDQTVNDYNQIFEKLSL